MEKQSVRPHFEEKASMDDEIDLFELWNGLVQEKLTVFLSFLMIIGLGTIYAFSVTPVYKSDAYLLPPKASEIQDINRLNATLGIGDAYSVNDVFNTYTENLLSRARLLTFFKQHNLIAFYEPDFKNKEKEVREKEFNDSFSTFVEEFGITHPKDGAKRVMVEMTLPVDADQVKEFLTQYIQKIRIETRKQITTDIFTRKQFLMQQLINQINAVKETAQKHREDKIARLDESIKVARQLKIKEPLSAGPAMNIQGVQNQGLPLYYLGYQVLEAEKDVLKKRKTDDAFTGKLRELEERYNLLDSVEINGDLFKVVNVDQPPEIGEKVKPKKALILAVSGVLGLMLGIFIALIRRAIKNRKASLAAS